MDAQSESLKKVVLEALNHSVQIYTVEFGTGKKLVPKAGRVFEDPILTDKYLTVHFEMEEEYAKTKEEKKT